MKENEKIIKILLDKHDLCLNDDIFEDVECGDLFEKEELLNHILINQIMTELPEMEKS